MHCWSPIVNLFHIMRIIKGVLLRYNYVLYTTTTHLWWFSRTHKIMQVAKPWKSSLISTLQVMDIVCVFSFAELKIRTRFPRWKKCRFSSPSLSSFCLSLSLCPSLSLSAPLSLSFSAPLSLFVYLRLSPSVSFCLSVGLSLFWGEGVTM